MTQPQAPTGQIDAAKLAALLALVKAQAAVRAQLTQAAVNAALSAFKALTPDDWWDAKKVNAAVNAALKIVQPTQRQAARITDAYLARVATVMTGRTHRPGSTVDVTRLRRQMPQQVARDLVDGKLSEMRLYLGEHDPAHRRVIAGDGMDKAFTAVVPDPGSPVTERLRRAREQRAQAVVLAPDAVYERIAEGYRHVIAAEGATEIAARQRALVRVATAAETDVTLAVREQYRSSLGKLRDVRGYRRILHPELSQTGPCGLCVVAADRVYHVEDLLPIHGRCVCEVLPIIGSLDPGIVLDRDDLNAIYAEAGGTGGDVIKDGQRHSAALKDVRVVLTENGEIGPWLVDADQHHRGPSQVAKTVVADKATRIRAQLESLDRTFAMFQRRQLAGESVEVPLTRQRQTIERLQRELAAL